MKRLLLILLSGVFVFGQSHAQNTGEQQIPEIQLTTIAQVNQGNSYITAPIDIGNIEPLWFEANIIPGFHIRQNKDSRLMGVLTPQIIIRMYQEKSAPVRTPSYIPQITVYYKLKSKTEANSLSIFGKIAHHSNGQDGEYLLENGEVNLKTGDFSTNFIEVGIIKTNFNKKFNAVQFFGTSFELHPEGLTNTSMIGSYGLYRWNSVFSIFKLPAGPHNKPKKRAKISLKGESTWMFGKLYDWDWYSLNRLNLSFTFYYHPRFLEEIGLFVNIYHGMDYYNIYFNHQINVIRFGIMTEILQF
jgi:outer membrane phospholipase A